MVFFLKIFFIFILKFRTTVLNDSKKNIVILKSIEIEKPIEEKRFLMINYIMNCLNNDITKEAIKSEIEKSSNVGNSVFLKNSKINFFKKKHKIFYKIYLEAFKKILNNYSVNIKIPDASSLIKTDNEIQILFKALKNNQEKEILDLLKIKEDIIIFEKPVYDLFVLFTCKMILVEILDNLDPKNLELILKTISYEVKLKKYNSDIFNLLNIQEKGIIKKLIKMVDFDIIEPNEKYMIGLYKYAEEIEWGIFDPINKVFRNTLLSLDIEEFGHKNFQEICFINEYKSSKNLSFHKTLDTKITKFQYFVYFDINQIFVHTIYEIFNFTDTDFNFDLFWKRIYEVYVVSCEKVFYDKIFKILEKKDNSLIYVDFIYNDLDIFCKLNAYFFLNNIINKLNEILEINCRTIFNNIIQLFYTNFVISLKNNMRNFDLLVYKDIYENCIMLTIKCNKRFKKENSKIEKNVILPEYKNFSI